MIGSLLTLLFVLCIVGVALWVLMQLPFIDATIKQVIKVVAIGVVAIVVIYFLFDVARDLGWVHSSMPRFRRD